MICVDIMKAQAEHSAYELTGACLQLCIAGLQPLVSGIFAPTRRRQYGLPRYSKPIRFRGFIKLISA